MSHLYGIEAGTYPVVSFVQVHPVPLPPMMVERFQVFLVVTVAEKCAKN